MWKSRRIEILFDIVLFFAMIFLFVVAIQYVKKYRESKDKVIKEKVIDPWQKGGINKYLVGGRIVEVDIGLKTTYIVVDKNGRRYKFQIWASKYYLSQRIENLQKK